MRTTRRGLGLFGAVVLSLAAVSCDCSSHAPLPPAMVVTSIEPLLFVAFQPVPFTLLGSGFQGGAAALTSSEGGPSPDGAAEVVITFAASAGTPFANGTSATAQVPGTVISDTQIQGTSPMTGAPGVWQCTVEVAAAGSSVTSAAPLAVFAGVTVFDVDQDAVVANQATPFEVIGFNFLPQNGSATVRFTSTVPGAFPGGADTLDVQGTVVGRTKITGVTPAFAVAGTVPGRVTVILDGEPNALPATTPEVEIAFLPSPVVPVVVTSIVPALPIGVATPFTIDGSGFVGGGAHVEVLFEATSGTPFSSGTGTVTTVLGTAISDTQVTGTSPTGTSATNVTAFVQVTRSDAVSGRSSTAIAQFTAPVETVGDFAPTVLPVDVGTAFSITGTNLTAPQAATVRFRALAGTPFVGGTAESVDVPANVTSATSIDGTSPLATATAEFLAEVTVVLQSGVALPMGVACMFVPPVAPPYLVVTNLDDSGAGSLRDTIQNAPAGSIVSFDPVLAGTVAIASTIAVPRSMHILGPANGAIRVHAPSGNFPVFTIEAAAANTIVDQLEVYGSRQFGDGGAFFVQGSLTLNRCLLRDNAVGGRGGSVFVDTNATFTATECTLETSNALSRGGAVFLSSGATAQVSASSFSECWANTNGGALYVTSTAVLSVVNCTFSGNVVLSGLGGVAYVEPNATLNLLHCTLASNFGGVLVRGTLNATNCIFSNANSDIENHGTNNTTFSLLRNGSASDLTHGQNGNLVGTSSVPIAPDLGLFRLNGGPTKTHALKPTSPALDVGTTSSETKDQRGEPRPSGPGPDMGAYEATVIL